MVTNKLRAAVLVDGGFFHKRYQHIFKDAHSHTPEQVADNLQKMVEQYLGADYRLYRLYYYDCEPLQKKFHHPLTGRVVDFAKLPSAKFRIDFFEVLRKRNKVQLRLGKLKENKTWKIRSFCTIDLLRGKRKISDLHESEVVLEVRQKGIDMQIGIDIAMLAWKKLADRIVLIGGDADFAPAAELARNEGVQFELDPMHNNIDAVMYGYVDGIISSGKATDKPETENTHAAA
ncbi:MAG: NYN domain-containing protein [Bacteroidia bacterium]